MTAGPGGVAPLVTEFFVEAVAGLPGPTPESVGGEVVGGVWVDGSFGAIDATGGTVPLTGVAGTVAGGFRRNGAGADP